MPADPRLDTPPLDLAADVAREFLLAVRRYWADRLYRLVADAARRAWHPGLGVDDIERALADLPEYQAFGWLEHHGQIAKYQGPDGLLAAADRQRDEVNAALDAAADRHPERLRLDPDLALPGYYTHTDFHLVPGGIHSRDYDGLVYEWAAGSVTLMGNEARDVHDSLAEYLADLLPAGGDGGRDGDGDGGDGGGLRRADGGAAVLDVGCGFGRTVTALGRLAPGARLVGVDLSAPALRLAHLRALQAGVVASFVQGNGEDLGGLPDGTFDIVTATMLVHELPGPALRALLRAARRVLRPGGRLVLLDFALVPGGTVGRFFHLGHARRNGEPFMPDLLDADLPAQLRAAGFTAPSLTPYPPGGHPDELPPRWRLPWTLIEAQAGPDTEEGHRHAA